MTNIYKGKTTME